MIDSENRVTPWRIYCKTIALGSGIAATYAKLCIRCDGAGHISARKNAKKMLRLRSIDDEGYLVRIEAIDTIEDMRIHGVQTHVTETPYDDWREIGGGCHQRRNHIVGGY